MEMIWVLPGPPVSQGGKWEAGPRPRQAKPGSGPGPGSPPLTSHAQAGPTLKFNI